MNEKTTEEGLVLLEQIKTSIGDHTITLDSARSLFEYMHQRAEADEDAQRMEVIRATWEQVSTVYQQRDQAISIADAVREVAVAMQEQRDQALEQHRALYEAVTQMKTEHPAINELVEVIGDSMIEGFFDAGVFLSACLGCEITEEGGIPVVHDVAAGFHDILVGEREVSPEIKQRLAQHMIEIVQMADAEDKAEAG